MNKLLLLPFLLLITAHAALAQDNGQILTLNQAIEIALKSNREAKNAKLEIDKAEDKFGAFRTRRLPSIKVSSLVSQPLSTFDTTFEKGVFGTYPGIGSVPNEDTVITSSTSSRSVIEWKSAVKKKIRSRAHRCTRDFVAAIFLALVFQFKNAIKPFIVFAAVPFGMVSALAALWIMGAPFGFMAFLGIVSLVGVIVSHIIVLFDFIEEKHAEGEPLIEALLDAGIMRLRPVLITVGATFITLLLVPVIYSIFVLDLKLVQWEPQTNTDDTDKLTPLTEGIAS